MRARGAIAHGARLGAIATIVSCAPTPPPSPTLIGNQATIATPHPRRARPPRSEPSKRGPGSLRGVMFDRRTGEAVAGATVVITQIRVAQMAMLTDEHGRYEFPEVPDGLYDVEAFVGELTWSVRAQPVAHDVARVVDFAVTLDAPAPTP